MKAIDGLRNEVYLPAGKDDMPIEILKTYYPAKGEIHFKPWQMFMLVFAFSWFLWCAVNFPYYSRLSGLALAKEIILDFAEQIVETIILLEVALFYFRMIVKYFWKRERTLKNLMLQVLILTVLNCVSSMLIGGVYKILHPSHEHIFVKVVFTDSFTLAVLTTCYIVVFLVNRYRDEAEAHLIAEKKLQEEEVIRLRAELKNLSLQTDNHFVFNCLSTLSGLIPSEPSKAESFLESLSRVDRYIVQNGNKDIVPLSAEIVFVKDYLNLMQHRYDGITVLFGSTINDTVGYVCPVSIQSLVENAIKHNRHNNNANLTIFISVKDGRVIVSNNIVPLDYNNTGACSGLRTLQDRYSLITDETVIINNEKGMFTVSIPILYSEPL